MARRVWYRSVWVWIIGLLVALVVTVAIWLLLPLRHAAAPAYAPPGATAYFHARLDRGAEATQMLVRQARERFLASSPGRLERAAFSAAVRYGMPTSVSGWIVPGDSASQPDFVGVVTMRRAGRVGRLFMGPMSRRLFGDRVRSQRHAGRRVRYSQDSTGTASIAAYTFFRDTFVFSSDTDLLRGAIEPDAVSTNNAAFNDDIAAALGTPSDLVFVGDNRSGNLTNLVRLAEKRLTFSIMPSADALSGITVVSRVENDAAAGQAAFTYDDAERVAEGRSDVRYLYGITRRLLRPRGLEMEGKMSVDELVVRLDFTIPEVERLLDSDSAEEM